MYISKLRLVNYRNFASTNLVFKKGINTVIGENGSGKTNIFRAVRLLLDENMVRWAHRLDKADFNRGIGRWQGHWIIISLEFEEVSQDEAVQALFLHGVGNVEGDEIGKATYNLIFRPNASIRLALSKLDSGDVAGMNGILDKVTTADYETLFTGKSTADFTSEAFYKRVVGDFINVEFNDELEFPEIGGRIPKVLSLGKEISFTCIQALRDVVQEFQSNRTNPLLTLLKSRSGAIDPALFAPIAMMVKDLNRSIEKLPDVEKLTSDITNTIKDAAGETYSPSSLSIKSDLSDEADELFQSLKLFVGEGDKGHEGGIGELSLGGANLIYLTLKLLEFKYQKEKQSFANFLLIEEPEAHIHTHVQKTLFDKLNYADTQIIYSTHSTHISEVSNVRNVNIIAKQSTYCEAFQPSSGLSEFELTAIQRYLDAVRSNLLFAKSVILVEGDAEEILIPILVKKVLGIGLDEMGISLVNIRSTGFRNVALLFHDFRIKKRCSIVTDLDAAFMDTTENAQDSKDLAETKRYYKSVAHKGASRKTALEEFVAGNSWLKCHFAPHTFEVDFVGAGNVAEVIGIIPEVYSDGATMFEAQADLASGNISQYGKRVLTMAGQEGKGWFAILLGRMIDHKTIIPTYILDAIFFAYPEVSDKVWSNILHYRVGCMKESGLHPEATIDALRAAVVAFDVDVYSISDVADRFWDAVPADPLLPIMRRF